MCRATIYDTIHNLEKMRTLKNILNLFFLILGHMFPRSRHKIAFGAWDGKSYSDNSKFLFEFFFNHPEWRIVWIGNKHERGLLPQLPPHASFATRHSLKGMWHALTAKTWVFSHNPNDISLVAVWGKALLIDTCHGVAIKEVGARSASFKHNKSLIDSFWQKVFANEIFLAVPSRIQAKNTLASFPNMFQKPTLPFGSTSLDFILKNKANTNLIHSLREKFAASFNLPIDKKWIVYAPTFRWTTNYTFSFRNMDANDFDSLSKSLTLQNAIIIEKVHPSRLGTGSPCANALVHTLSGDIAKNIEPHELWLAADAIISDYSSCVVPFFLQEKPVIHFAYDYEYYTTKDTGLIANIDDIRFGSVVYTFSDLCNAISDLYSSRNKCGHLAKSLIEYEKGNACEQYLEFIRNHMSGLH